MKRLLLAGLVVSLTGCAMPASPEQAVKFINDPAKLSDCANTGNNIIHDSNDLFPHWINISQSECKDMITAKEKEKADAEKKKRMDEHFKQYVAKQEAYDKAHPVDYKAEAKKGAAACRPFANDLAAKYNVGKPSSISGRKGGLPNIYYCTIDFKRQNVYGMTEQHFAVFTVNTANGQYEVSSFN